jgi:hydrogenase-1 operon protein HyaE
MSRALEKLSRRPDVVALNAASLPAFIAEGTVALFFTGNAERYPEIDDLATVLPELQREFQGQFRIGVIDPDAERDLARKYRISIRPTLVFLRNGAELGTLPRLRDWALYLDEISRLLARPETAVA